MSFNHLGVWLPRILKRKNLSPEQLAQKSSISRASIYKWMTDHDRPTEESMARVCRVLEVSLTEGLSQYTPRKRGRPRGV